MNTSTTNGGTDTAPLTWRDRDRDLMLCKRCRQAARLDLHGDRLTFTCFGGCRHDSLTDADRAQVIAELRQRRAATVDRPPRLAAPRLDEVPSGAQLLEEIVELLRRFVVMSSQQADVLALWVVHTYAVEAAESTPYLAITSAEKRSGKSLLIELLSMVVARPLTCSNISDAALFRSIAADAPTLLFDEVDAIFGPKARDREDLRGMINAGHRRGAEVRRCGGANRDQLEAYPVFGPKALAGIGDLPDTVADRALPIRLERRGPGERAERFRRRAVEPEAAALRGRLEHFAEAAVEPLEGAWPALPAELDDRAQDAAEPLLAIADLAGGNWPEVARRAVVELRAERLADDDSVGLRLLADVRDIFDRRTADRLSTADVLGELHRLEEAPWSEWRGKPLTSRGLADLLRPYRIKGKVIRVGDGTARGYLREQFEVTWNRYLPASSPSIRNGVTTRIVEPKTPDSQTSQLCAVTGGEGAANPHARADVAHVTDRAPDAGPEAPEREWSLA